MRWLKQDRQIRPMDHAYYKLDHEYTEASLSLNTLKNQDLKVVQTLKDISSILPVIFLATLEKEEVRECDDMEYDYYDRKYGYSELDDDEDLDDYDGGYPRPAGDLSDITHTINSLVDLNDCPVAKGMRLDATKVIQAGGFDEVDPEGEYQGHTGNEVYLRLDSQSNKADCY